MKAWIQLAVALGVLVGSASVALAQVAVDCGTAVTSLAGDPGTELTITCPANCTSGSVWGTSPYTDDSSVCVAAIHAGALTAAGGTTTIAIVPGQDSYPSGSANGVTTSQWGSWGRGFVFQSAAVQLTCSQNAQTLAGDPGRTYLVNCPASCTSSTIWGASVYSDDSAVCTAAIHAGVLTAAGGQTVVTIAPGQASYSATTANGVTSSSWGSWGRSFTVAAP
jgi:hypothetical protein